MHDIKLEVSICEKIVKLFTTGVIQVNRKTGEMSLTNSLVAGSILSLDWKETMARKKILEAIKGLERPDADMIVYGIAQGIEKFERTTSQYTVLPLYGSSDRSTYTNAASLVNYIIRGFSARNLIISNQKVSASEDWLEDLLEIGNGAQAAVAVAFDGYWENPEMPKEYFKMGIEADDDSDKVLKIAEKCNVSDIWLCRNLPSQVIGHRLKLEGVVDGIMPIASAANHNPGNIQLISKDCPEIFRIIARAFNSASNPNARRNFDSVSGMILLITESGHVFSADMSRRA